MTQLKFVLDLSRDELSKRMMQWGEPSYRVDQLWHSLYQEWVQSFHEISVWPKHLRHRAEKALAMTSLVPIQSVESRDGKTKKILFDLNEGGSIEAVRMKYARRITACISSQAGCAMGCVFCGTGQMGLTKDLSTGQILEQVFHIARDLRSEGKRLTNIVVMGMGEPFHNYEETMSAMDRLNDPDGFNFGARRVTISTVGLIPMIERFAHEERRENLAISLHAATDDLRDRLIPVNKKYPISALIQACRQYSKRSGRRVSFEWAMIAGVNDGLEQAKILADLLQGMLCHVNLIPLNPTFGFSGAPTTAKRIEDFQSILQKSGIPVSIRIRRGLDIQAGCGQLAAKSRSTLKDPQSNEKAPTSGGE